MGQKRNPYYPGTTYRKLKDRFRGEVKYLDLESGFRTVAIVYGRTLEEMRARRNVIVQSLNDACDENYS